MIQKVKKQLRTQIAATKASLPASTLEAWSAEIMERLERQPVFRQAHTVLLYYAMKDEVDTRAFIEKWRTGKRIILPVVTGENTLELRTHSSPADLSVGAYGILEPAGEAFTTLSAIDLAVIPGVAFDANGNRLGRGKGYYDRLLPALTAYKIGICFPFQLVDEVPADEFDVKMDEVMTAGLRQGTACR